MIFNNITIDNFVKHGGYNDLNKIFTRSGYYIHQIDIGHGIGNNLFGMVNDKPLLFKVSYEKPSCNYVYVDMDGSLIIDNFKYNLKDVALSDFFSNNYDTKDYIIGYRIDNICFNMHFICGTKYKQIPCFDIVFVGGKYSNLVYKS
jgi:hypothetical protein